MIARIKTLLSPVQRQFLAYSLIGCSGLAIDYGLFFGLHHGLGLYYLMANGISVFVAVSNNFVWNALLNFKVKDNILIRYLSFLGVGAVGLLISTGLLWVQVEMFGLSPMIGKGLTIFVVVIVQFSLNKWITFKT